mmetsp:Transcript_66094/g.162704  ORF Transcript_66094/g.162704 Transcript_66094/m.162704 type:complete len:214 (-) Transcript_66094:553-1194(-)
MLSATMRPCRFAGPAMATIHWSPNVGFRTSIASPTAQMLGSSVRRYSSTMMPPRAPSLSPASPTSLVSARTPSPRITRSAWRRVPEARRTSLPTAPSVGSSKEPMPSLMMTRTPCFSSSVCSIAAISSSRGAMICGSASTSTTSRPLCFSCSAISTPMKPAPATTTRLAAFSLRYPSILSMSCRLRSAMLPSRSIPLIGGTNGFAPTDSTRSS